MSIDQNTYLVGQAACEHQILCFLISQKIVLNKVTGEIGQKKKHKNNWK